MDTAACNTITSFAMILYAEDNIFTVTFLFPVEQERTTRKIEVMNKISGFEVCITKTFKTGLTMMWLPRQPDYISKLIDDE